DPQGPERETADPGGALDELFPRGSEACVLVLKDEHGRLLAAQEVKKRGEENVKSFLERFKKLVLDHVKV
ncbi:MAG TPA: hypothetical protein VE844_04725, partial [Gammaproteobacteria bacterium]|nr:hypothetical protein [Gammaproteobacteria bacterium]